MKLLKKLSILACASILLIPALSFAQTTSTTSTPATEPVVEKTTEAPAIVTSPDIQEGTYESAIILKADSILEETDSGGVQIQAIDVEFLSGPLKGQTRRIASDVSGNPYGLKPEIGDKVLIYLQPNPEGGEAYAFLEGFERRAAIYWLVALFVLTLVLLAGWQGLKIAASIIISVLLIGFVLIPAFLNGLNPIPVTFALIAVLTTITTVFTVGWNKKAFVTIIGTLGGTLVAYLIATLFSGPAHLSGLSTEEDRLFFSKNPQLDPRGLLFAGIAIAAMGVVEDVAVSISSGVMEVREANHRLGFKELFRSGMVVGRDHMGALANTLVFAYVGASLSTLLLYTQYGGSWAKFLNFDLVVDEIVRSLAGTIGLVFTVPITALLAAWAARRMLQTEIRKPRAEEETPTA